MTAPVGTARITITGDLNEFARTADARLRAAMQGLGRIVNSSGGLIEDEFGRIATRSGEIWTRDLNGQLRDANGELVSAGRQAAEAYQRGLEEGMRAGGNPFGPGGPGGAGQREEARLSGERSGDAYAEGFGSRAKAGISSLALGATLLATVGAGVAVAAVKSGLQTASMMEQANIAFSTLLGSGEKAKSFMGDLSTFAAATPFELPGLIDAARSLIGVGASAQSVIPTLTAYGDASGALGISQDGFNHIMLATTQAMSAGTLHAGDLLQMTEAGLPVWKIMSEAMGLPVATLKKMGDQGQLLSADVLPKMQAQMEKDYGGSMAKQANTMSGLWSTLMDTFHQGMASALIPMEPMLRVAIPAAANIMSGALGALGNGAQQLFGGLSGNVKTMDQDSRPKLELFGLGVRALFQAFQNGDVTSDGFVGVMERIGVTLRSVFTAIGGYVNQAKGIIIGLIPAFQNMAAIAVPLIIQMWGAWQALQGPIHTVASVIIGMVVPAIVAVTGFMAKHKEIVQTLAVAVGAIIAAMKIWTVVTKIWEAVTMGAALAIRAVNTALAANPIGLIVLAIIGLVAGLIYAYTHFQTFRNIVNGTWSVIRTGAEAVIGFFKTWGPLILALIMPVIGIPILIWQHFSQIVGFLQTAWGMVVGFLVQWGPLALAVLFPFIGIPLLIWQHFSLISGYVSTAFNAVIGFLGSIPARLVGALGNLGGLLVNAGTALISGLRQGAAAGVGILSYWLFGLPMQMLSWLGNVGGLLYSVGMDLIRGFINGIKDAAGMAVSAVKGVVGDAISGAKHLLGIGSPSRVFHEIGVNTLQGYTRGVKAESTNVYKQVATVAGDVTDMFDTQANFALDLSAPSRPTYAMAGAVGPVRAAAAAPSASDASGAGGMMSDDQFQALLAALNQPQKVVDANGVYFATLVNNQNQKNRRLS